MSPFLRQPVLERSQVAEIGVVVVPEREPLFDGGRLDRNSRARNLRPQALVQLRKGVHAQNDVRPQDDSLLDDGLDQAPDERLDLGVTAPAHT